MDQTFREEHAWYRALTLTERLESLRAAGRERPKVELNADTADRTVRRWREHSSLSNDTAFAQRLAADRMSEAELRQLLGEPIETLRDRFPTRPAWMAELTSAFASLTPMPIPLPDELRGEPMAGALDAIAPLIERGRDHLRWGIDALIRTCSALPFDRDTIEDLLFADLPGRLIRMMSRTIALELHVARLRGVLQGDTAAERFQSFLQRVRDRDTALALFQEYPVLARQLMICIDQWTASSLEFLSHVCADWAAIRSTFTPDHDPGILVAVDGGVGDGHRGGRAVLIARFSSDFQVVYKPRSLAVDVHFQEFLTWINQRGDHPPFRTLKILDRGAHGWVEYVAAGGCDSDDQIRRFYERQGSYLALLYALAATDFHSENLIAAGEHPILLDLEALFHPQVGRQAPTRVEEIVGAMLVYSVLSVGLLPVPSWTNAEGESIDLSGFGAKAGQLTPQGVPQWNGAGTDEMRLIRERVIHPTARNRPSLGGMDVDVPAYIEAITTGFTKMYRLLMKYRVELLAAHGPLSRFADDEVRVILRNTRTYDQLLFESFHPDVLRSALDRDRLFDRLWLQIEQRPYLANIISSEREDLRKGDIPLLTTRPNSRAIWNSSGERLADLVDEPGLKLAQDRLRRLSDDDLARQLWFIRASLATLSADGDRTPAPAYVPPEPSTIADHKQLLAAARAVCDRLETLALRHDDAASWVGLTLQRDHDWSLTPLETDLYDGLPGVVLFLAYLGALTHDERYTRLAQAGLTTLRYQIEQRRSLLTSIGGFTGWGGVIYTLAHLGVLWGQPALLIEAEACVERLPALIARDEQLDIVAGAAGCIGSLISLYRFAPSAQTLSAALMCGDRLLARADPMEHGIAWSTPVAPKPLSGFSHGAAGMAWALLELSALSGTERFREAALGAMAYERSLFVPEAGNWPDLRRHESQDRRVDNDRHACMTAWCHGAPGIGLARLHALRHLNDATLRAEINVALQTTCARGFGSNHSLCHGDLGNLELLLQASETSADPYWYTQTQRFATMILESISRHGWLCGVPLRVESPGLMTGLAGIGYGFLRLADPVRVPAVLTLAPPRS